MKKINDIIKGRYTALAVVFILIAVSCGCGCKRCQSCPKHSKAYREIINMLWRGRKTNMIKRGW